MFIFPTWLYHKEQAAFICHDKARYNQLEDKDAWQNIPFITIKDDAEEADDNVLKLKIAELELAVIDMKLDCEVAIEELENKHKLALSKLVPATPVIPEPNKKGK